MENKKILVVGGDGFCGWPTALELANSGAHVVIIDNFIRRKLDSELNIKSLTNIFSLEERLIAANQMIGKIDFEFCDVAKDLSKVIQIISDYKIDTIVHLGEIKSAPYSMIDSNRMNFTVHNNIMSTSNLLSAIVEVNKDIHLVHLGTMGVYGYKDEFGKIPEGYLNVVINSTKKDASILFPTDPGSIYHMTKSMDQILFQFFNNNWGIKITDLHQGIVWGTQTNLTKKNVKLINRFDYDGIWGTVLNRFIVEAAINYPLTVHGSGEQTRAFIHLKDTTNCIKLAIKNPPAKNEKVKILNQVTETYKVIDLAKFISKKTNCGINYVENPRNERKENDLQVSNEALVKLGHKLIKINDQLVDDIFFIVNECKENINKISIPAKIKWVK